MATNKTIKDTLKCEDGDIASDLHPALDVSHSDTLPSVSPFLGEMSDNEGIAISVIFHPVVDRIGERAFIAQDQTLFSINRNIPAFGKTDSEGAGTGLCDPYISRSPLRVEQRDGDIYFTLRSGSSRVFINDREVSSSGIRLPDSCLSTGVVIFLANRIVLLMRRDIYRTEPVGDVQMLIGSSTAMQQLCNKILPLAKAGADVMIKGESGTGKELVAQMLHRLGPRSSAPFVPLNMSAIPCDLGAVELFGCERGAFTGADSRRSGYFGQAEGGTLFLDEVGDTPALLQPQLLRALQQREIQPVGGRLRKVDVTIISATDRDLESSELAFSHPLRYRLSAVEVEVPSLSRRREDLGELALFFIKRYCREFNLDIRLPENDKDPTQQAFWAFMFYQMALRPWRGNVRQLESTIKRLLLSNCSDVNCLPEVDKQIAEPELSKNKEYRTTKTISPRQLYSAMRDSDWKISQAARKLGVSRQCLYRRIGETDGLRLAVDISCAELTEALNLHAGKLSCAASYLQVSRVALERRLKAVGIPWR